MPSLEELRGAQFEEAQADNDWEAEAIGEEIEERIGVRGPAGSPALSPREIEAASEQRAIGGRRERAQLEAADMERE